MTEVALSNNGFLLVPFVYRAGVRVGVSVAVVRRDGFDFVAGIAIQLVVVAFVFTDDASLPRDFSRDDFVRVCDGDAKLAFLVALYALSTLRAVIRFLRSCSCLTLALFLFFWRSSSWKSVSSFFGMKGLLAREVLACVPG